MDDLMGLSIVLSLILRQLAKQVSSMIHKRSKKPLFSLFRPHLPIQPRGAELTEDLPKARTGFESAGFEVVAGGDGFDVLPFRQVIVQGGFLAQEIHGIDRERG